MQKPKSHPDEERRQFQIDALEILDTPADERFDRITRLARELFDTRIALVSLVDRERQWFKSSQGLQALETERSVSFCAHAVATQNTLIVEDARTDSRFAGNPLVVGEPEIRSYAGVLVHSPQGLPMGTLCVIDCEPRVFSQQEIQTLEDLAKIVESEFERGVVTTTAKRLISRLKKTEKKLAIDPLTRVWRREHILELAELERKRSQAEKTELSLFMIDIDDFSEVNNVHGHLVGDDVLAEVSQQIRRGLRLYDGLGRYGGEEFLALLPDTSFETAMRVAQRVVAAIAKMTIHDLSISVSVGVATFEEGDGVRSVIARADAALLAAKGDGKNRASGSFVAPKA